MTRLSAFQAGLAESLPLARELPARDYRRIKAGTRDLLEACGNARAAALHTRLQQPRLDACASDAQPRDFLPADVVADLEAACGRPVLTAALAELAGCALVPLPAWRAAVSGLDALVAAARETSEAVAAGWAAHSDGVVTPAERETLKRELRDAVAALLALDARLDDDGEEAT